MVFTFVISIDRSLCNIDKGYWYHNEGIEREREEMREKPTPITLPLTNYFQIWKNEEKREKNVNDLVKEKSTFYLLKKISDKNLSCQIHVKAMGDRRKHVVIFE